MKSVQQIPEQVCQYYRQLLSADQEKTKLLFDIFILSGRRNSNAVQYFSLFLDPINF